MIINMILKFIVFVIFGLFTFAGAESIIGYPKFTKKEKLTFALIFYGLGLFFGLFATYNIWTY